MYKINIDCIRVNGLDHTFNLLSVMYYYDLFYVNIKKLITYSTPYKNSQLMIFCWHAQLITLNHSRREKETSYLYLNRIHKPFF
jgi:hypothetical protein